ncbi:toxin of toxin-antitoxin system [Rickettsia bellii]|uniref:Putative mRNA interferase YoeB n=1 Tax=Rickettsia bellii (strain RML369-C) TaxID=336407 RepID=Q1RJ59_RICBR|nr:Txe/YoeB family addiction module toxin [Rickettsia bellii]ABE04605.1 Putative toxin of toxin-antitoxin (TA) system [Rickettsia bellii RML369-C]ABV78968.1 Putative toxin of toxin-antitoxin (TA) system [Rickettsia bellii OSU 85-389]ARD86880.1 toxin of toxin-antitoxin system [Rickettsia bellii]
MYVISYTKQAQKDAKKIARAGLKNNVELLLNIISTDPWKAYPPYEKLIGDLSGCYSRRINIQHRLVYEVYKEEKIVKVFRMWTHYE